MILSMVADLLVFSVTTLGPGLALATCFRGFNNVTRVSLGLGAALVALYLACFARYLLHLPPAGLWAVVPAAAALLAARRAEAAELLADPAVRRTCGHWLVLAAWCLGWQALVVSYAGGGWSGDWLEHYDRAFFFLRHWPTDQLFLDLYPLPARPPLANLLVGGWLGLAGGRFFHFQIFSTLLASLVIFPLAGCVQRLRPGARAPAVLLLLLMVSPLLVQNATFPWTKLPAAFFVILAADLLSETPAAFRPANLGLALPALAAGLLVHYSAAIWIVALLPAWWLTRRPLLAGPGVRRALLLGGLVAAVLGLTWIGWSLATYGAATTFLANSTVTLAPATTAGLRVANAVTNVYHTLVPTWLWEGIPGLMQQESPVARLRDRWFCLYQLTLPFAFGLGGLLVLGRELVRRGWPRDPQHRFWFATVGLLLVANGLATPWGDPLGLTHIALQPLVLLGLAWLAALADSLPGPWVRGWIWGAVIDFLFGVALHFGQQSLWLERWLAPGRSELEIVRRLSPAAAANYYGKMRAHLDFLSDGFPPWLALALLAGAAALALRAHRTAVRLGGA